jgi:hypothetical protein
MLLLGYLIGELAPGLRAIINSISLNPVTGVDEEQV